VPGPVSVVTLLGDSRCGKSTLASRLIDDERLVFPVGNTGVAVTEGIDMCIVPRRGSSEGTLVILDCEGCNNPTGSVHGAIDLIAMFTSTLTVQVVWGHMSESQLWQIGQGIALCDRLLDNDKGQRLPARRLLFVVNGCHLAYDMDQLEKTFFGAPAGSTASRNELRANIRQAFEQIDFVTIPREDDLKYSSKLEAFRSVVDKECSPTALGGVSLSGVQIVDMFKYIVDQLRTAGTVVMPSVFRHVIFEQMLKPLVQTLLENFKADLPNVSDGEFRSTIPDRRNEILQQFDQETGHLTHGELIAEAREDLKNLADAAFQQISDRNAAIGEQDRHVATESEMRYSHMEDRVVSANRRSRCCCCVDSTVVVKPCSVCRLWTRTWVLKKNGRIVCSEWVPTARDRGGSSCKLTLSSSSTSPSLMPLSELDGCALSSVSFDLDAAERPLGLTEVLKVMAESDLSFDEARHQIVLAKMAEFGIDESGLPVDSKLVTFSPVPSITPRGGEATQVKEESPSQGENPELMVASFF